MPAIDKKISQEAKALHKKILEVPAGRKPVRPSKPRKPAKPGKTRQGDSYRRTNNRFTKFGASGRVAGGRFATKADAVLGRSSANETLAKRAAAAIDAAPRGVRVGLLALATREALSNSPEREIFSKSGRS